MSDITCRLIDLARVLDSAEWSTSHADAETCREAAVEIERLRLLLLSQAEQWESEANQCAYECRSGAAWDFRRNAKECRDAAEAGGE